MTKEELILILQEGEGYKIEFKENVNTDLSKEIVAFSNSSGGRIFIGVNDNSQIIGVKDMNALKSRVQDIAKNCDPSIFLSIDVLDNILIITVPEGPNKPYKNTNGFFIRNGANSQKLTTSEIIDFLNYEGKIRFDEIVRNDVAFIDAFNPELYSQYLELTEISNVLDTESTLENLNVLVPHEKTKYLNNAGVLVFGHNPTRFIYQCSVVCALYKGEEKVTVLDRKELTGSVIQNIEDALIFLKKHLNLRYLIEGTRRKDILEIPEIALRESVVNAICHRDYFEKGASVMIEIFDDRVDITNPGGLPKSLKPKDFGKRSVTRNPILASLLQRANFIEKMGTGISRIRKAILDAKLPEPIFEFDTFFTVSFSRVIINDDDIAVANDDANATINATINTTIKEELGIGISSAQAKKYATLIKLIRSTPGLNSGDIAKQMGVDETTVRRWMQKLSNIISHRGSRKTGGYHLTNTFEQKLKQANASK